MNHSEHYKQAMEIGSHNPVKKIDTANRYRPRYRHVIKSELPGGAILTLCGKVIRHFFDAQDWHGYPVSYFYTDGTRFSTPCKHCLPKDYADANLS